MFQDETCVPTKIFTPKIEANYFASEFLIPGDNFFELAFEYHTYTQIASLLGIHTELAMIKSQTLNSKGYKLNVPYIPEANFSGKL